MKEFLSERIKYSPGVVGEGYLDITSIPKFKIERLIAIINQTKGKILYTTGSEIFKYLLFDGSKIFFNVDTTSDLSTDSIQVIYDTESDTVDMTVMLQTLISIIANPGIRDRTQNADRVTLVGGSTTISSGTINNILAQNGYQAQIPVINNNIAAWYLSCRSKIN